MKLFSLESKRHLIIWSVLIGILVSAFAFYLTYIPATPAEIAACEQERVNSLIEYIFPCQSAIVGWPFRTILSAGTDHEMHPVTYFFILRVNTIIFVFATLIILSLIRYGMRRSKQKRVTVV